MNPIAERNRLKREMEQKIYKELPPEKKEAYIQERIQRSLEKHQRRTNKSKAFQKCVKEGLAYARLNRIPFYSGGFGAYNVSASVILKTGEDNIPYYQVAYAFCSPKDSYSDRVGRGLSAHRLLFPDKTAYSFKVNLSERGALSPDLLCKLVSSYIEMEVYTRRVRAPKKLYRQAVKSHMSFNSHCVLFIKP